MTTLEKLKRAALVTAAAGVVLCLALLVSGRRVLISETKVEPGQHYFAGEWGDLGTAQQAQLACRFFTGRSVKLNVYWYSPNNIMGRDSCPFIEKP